MYMGWGLLKAIWRNREPSISLKDAGVMLLSSSLIKGRRKTQLIYVSLRKNSRNTPFSQKIAEMDLGECFLLRSWFLSALPVPSEKKPIPKDARFLPAVCCTHFGCLVLATPRLANSWHKRGTKKTLWFLILSYPLWIQPLKRQPMSFYADRGTKVSKIFCEWRPALITWQLSSSRRSMKWYSRGYH